MPRRSYLKHGRVRLGPDPLGKPVWSSARKGHVIGTVIYASPGSSFVRLRTCEGGTIRTSDLGRA